ncbi:MAG: hypothetical protein AAFO84_09190 [Cyanobacteria bacterium J06598_1]
MVPELNKDVMQAVESLKYRVTVGEVAANAGLNVEMAQQGLLVLASETQGHMQVSETGEIAYEFPKNFRSVLRNKYWRLRYQELLAKIWQVVFYIIRLSFGVMLLVSIAIIAIAIIALMIAASSQGGGSSSNNDRRGRGGSFGFSPFHIFYLFDFNYGRGRRRYPNQYSGRYSGGGRSRAQSADKLQFLEAIYSFLFGDGDPNADLEERRWQTIGTVINNNGGAIVAEQVAPYLDDLGKGFEKEYEDYMLPVLTRFNGQPEVSPTGDMVYYFPELQVSAMERRKASVSAYLKETKRKFTQATSDQVMLAIGLGSANIIGAVVLQNMLQSALAQGLQLPVAAVFAQSILGLLMVYGVSFLVIPLLRYNWVKWQNGKIESRNSDRAERATALNRLGEAFQQKLAFAQQFASRKVLNESEAVYSTETDLVEQGGDPLEAEFRRRLNEI